MSMLFCFRGPCHYCFAIATFSLCNYPAFISLDQHSIIGFAFHNGLVAFSHNVDVCVIDVDVCVIDVDDVLGCRSSCVCRGKLKNGVVCCKLDMVTGVQK